MRLTYMDTSSFYITIYWLMKKSQGEKSISYRYQRKS